MAPGAPGQVTDLTRTSTWVLAATGLLALLTVSATVAGGLGGLLAGGETTYVRIVQTSELGVVAGLVTAEDEGPLGPLIGDDTHVPETGWVVLHPKGDRLLGDGPVTVTAERPFTDPNGGTWLAREIAGDGGTGWVVPVGSSRYDATLDASYNFAVIVDWDQVPADTDLVATYHETLPLDRSNGEGPQP